MSPNNNRLPIPISTAYVCAYVVRKDDRGYKFLLLKRQSRYMFGLWGQVAGKVENGETAVQAILREISEETGQAPLALYSADIIESFYDIEYNTIQMIPAFVAFLESPDIILSHEHSEFKWVTPADAKALFPFPIQKASVDTIVREFLEKEPLPQLKIQIL
jgi:dATP pyrophosphohydrolase